MIQRKIFEKTCRKDKVRHILGAKEKNLGRGRRSEIRFQRSLGDFDIEVTANSCFSEKLNRVSLDLMLIELVLCFPVLVVECRQVLCCWALSQPLPLSHCQKCAELALMSLTLLVCLPSQT